MNASRCIATVVLSIICVGFLVSIASADCIFPDGTTAGWLWIWSKTGVNSLPPYPPNCRVDQGVDTLVIQVRAIPFQRISFTLQDPPFGTVLGEQWFFPHAGNRQTGIELDTGCMTAGTVKLGEIFLTVDFNVVSPTICAPWSGTAAQLQNCAGRRLPAAFMSDNIGGYAAYDCPLVNCWQCAHSTPPFNLYPPDGATNVPLNAKFSWEGAQNAPNCHIYISRDPTCATGQDITPYPPQCGSFDPGPLSPNTTYYWRPYWYIDDGWGSAGWAAIQSFKTVADPLSTQSSTWGHVKAMYRE